MEPTVITGPKCEHFQAPGGKHVIIGYPALNERPVFSIKPGDRIKKIGKPGRGGGETSSNRMDDFKTFVTYKGIHTYEGDDWACFLVPDGEISRNDKPISEPCYVAYLVQEDIDELYIPYTSRGGGSIQIFKAIFEVVPELEISQRKTSVLENYPGAKSNSGIGQWLINRIPYHDQYAELYAGSARLYAAKRGAGGNILNDVNPKVAESLNNKYGVAAMLAGNIDACAAVFNRPALELIAEYGANPAAFLYLDPPYPFASRRGQRKLYTYEMNDADHVQLLAAVRTCKAMVMISTRQNCLYDHELKDWRKEIFDTVDRGGAAQEIIYMNYPPPAILHQYDHLGEGYIDRQRIKRKVQRFGAKIQELAPYEKHALIQELLRHDAAAVQHFLSIPVALK